MLILKLVLSSVWHFSEQNTRISLTRINLFFRQKWLDCTKLIILMTTIFVCHDCSRLRSCICAFTARPFKNGLGSKHAFLYAVFFVAVCRDIVMEPLWNDFPCRCRKQKCCHTVLCLWENSQVTYCSGSSCCYNWTKLSSNLDRYILLKTLRWIARTTYRCCFLCCFWLMLKKSIGTFFVLPWSSCL